MWRRQRDLLPNNEVDTDSKAMDEYPVPQLPWKPAMSFPYDKILTDFRGVLSLEA